MIIKKKIFQYKGERERERAISLMYHIKQDCRALDDKRKGGLGREGVRESLARAKVVSYLIRKAQSSDQGRL